jgi:hypothetical protein
MKRIATITALLLAAGTAVGLARTSPVGSPRLDAERACPGVDWNGAGRECFGDQRHRFGRGSQDLDCSIHVFAPRPTRFTARLTYDGQLQRSYSTVVHGRSHRGIGIVFPGLGTPPTPAVKDYGLPAGPYGCEFTLGSQRVAFSFEVPGPPSTGLMPSVCQGAGTWDHACDFDLAQPGFYPLPPTHSVACSAVFARLQGHQADFDFLRQEAGAWTLIDAERDRLAHSITQEGAWTSAAPGQFLPDGHYACRILIDGALAVEKQFDISDNSP